MIKEVDDILLSLFNNKNIEQLDKDELESIALEHPYSSLFQLVYALKATSTGETNLGKICAKTAIHFPENLRAVDLLVNMGSHQPGYLADSASPVANDQPSASNTTTETFIDADKAAIKPHAQAPASDVVALHNVESKDDATELNQLIPIDPYHTVDYFASQGIKLSQIDQSDELGIKVKSFTAWLKTMKKIQLQGSPVARDEIIGAVDKTTIETTNETIDETIDEREDELEDELEDETVRSKNELIVTEAMAEVYLKQGLTDKAVAVYTKLSLQNPSNSHIFARKISAIKEN